MSRSGSVRLLASCTLSLLLLTQVIPASVRAQSQEPSSPPPSAGIDPEPAARRLQLMRRSNSYLGPVGGIHVIEAGSGAPGSMRLQVMTDFFLKSDYLSDGDDIRYVGGALSVGVTPIEHLELTVAATMKRVHDARSQGGEAPDTVQSIADPYFDVKTYGEIGNGVTLGADALLSLITAPADDSLDYAGMSVGLRGNLSVDLRRTSARVPLELRLNAGYFIDQSAKGIEQQEKSRLNALVASGQGQDVGANNEYRHLAPRIERLAYNVNRVDHASVAVGLEAPIALSKRVALHPIAEWELWIPVNRQDYECPLSQTGAIRVPGDDRCASKESAGHWPHRFTAGARLFPAPNFSLLAAVEVGIGGMNRFVREFAPTAPYRIFLAASYAIDLRPARKEIVPPPPVDVPVVPKQGQVRGTVVERGPGTPVANARVVVTGSSEPPLTASFDGRFLTEPLPVGDVALALEADGYEPGTCAARIPPEGGEVLARCELVALPRVGSVVGHVLGANGTPVAGATVQLTGPMTRSPVTAADGSFRELDLPPGDYQVRVDQEGYLLSVTPLLIELRREAQPQITLVPKPRKPLVVVQKARLLLKETVFFNTDTAELQTRSEPLLTEVADALLRTPAVLRVEVQGHTDNVGTAEYNADLAQRRAESVRNWLIGAGVAADRLIAKGYGLTQPIASNKREAGRAKNRRVAFIILERATPP